MSITTDATDTAFLAQQISNQARFAASAFIAGYGNPGTRRDYTTHLKFWFKFLADHNVDPLVAQRFHVELWMRSLEGEGRAPRTRQLKLAVVRSFYRYCADEGWIETSPAERVKGPYVERVSPSSALARTQFAELIEGAAALGSTQHVLVMILGFMGLRISEACNIDIEHVQMEKMSPVLFLPHRKGGKSQTVGIPQPVMWQIPVIAEERTSGPLLLNKAGNRMTRSNAQGILDQAAKSVKGNPPRIHPHLLRHTWCTLASDAGVSPARIMHDGGWADMRMQEYYNHSRNDPLNSANHLVAAWTLSAT